MPFPSAMPAVGRPAVGSVKPCARAMSARSSALAAYQTTTTMTATMTSENCTLRPAPAHHVRGHGVDLRDAHGQAPGAEEAGERRRPGGRRGPRLRHARPKPVVLRVHGDSGEGPARSVEDADHACALGYFTRMILSGKPHTVVRSACLAPAVFRTTPYAPASAQCMSAIQPLMSRSLCSA